MFDGRTVLTLPELAYAIAASPDAGCSGPLRPRDGESLVLAILLRSPAIAPGLRPSPTRLRGFLTL